MEEALKQMQIEKLASAHGLVSIKKQRRKRQKRIVKDLLVDYASNSTLHGLRYITAKGLSIFEKLFWLATFLVSIGMCSYLINNVYIKWITSPVIITVSERLVSVSSVPFPSITICPQIKCKASVYNVSKKTSKLRKMMKNNESIDRDALEMHEDISMICGGLNIRELRTNRSVINGTKFVDTITKVSPSLELNEVLLTCAWHGLYFDNNLFQSVLTAEGVCFNMNGLASKELFRDSIQSDYNYVNNQEPSRGWSFTYGYNNSERDPYPRRGSENRPSPDLEVSLYSYTNDADVLCNGLNAGYKIYLSHPADLPQSSMYYYAAINNQVSSLAVSFHVLNTSETLSNYSPEDRQCYFPKDRELRYFKIYTVRNCRAECLSNYTFNICGCVGYYMPHDNSSNICGMSSTPCMYNAQEYMASEELRLQEQEGSQQDECQCLQACNNVEYDAEILKTEFNLASFIKSTEEEELNKTFDETIMKFSKIEVYFKKPEFVSMRRSELFGVTDFVANIGGLLGVFLGFSFLSLVEIMYFITIRIGFTLKRDLSNEKNVIDSVKAGKCN